MRTIVPYLAALACLSAFSDAFSLTPSRPLHGVRRMTMAATSASRSTAIRYAADVRFPRVCARPFGSAPACQQRDGCWTRHAQAATRVAERQQYTQDQV